MIKEESFFFENFKIKNLNPLQSENDGDNESARFEIAFVGITF